MIDCSAQNSQNAAVPTPVRVDIFVTYHCNFRCCHCFLGDLLELGQHMEWGMLEAIIDRCADWGTQEVTFLGGEPTLYPHLIDAIVSTQQKGMVARIVTNGGASFQRFIENLSAKSSTVYPHTCFSIDGIRETHDQIRQRGSYERLIDSIEWYRKRRLNYSGIFSVSTKNYHEIELVLEQCAQLAFEYVNVHYVTNRGRADNSMVLAPDLWKIAVARTKSAALRFGIKTRLEETFLPAANGKIRCQVTSNENLMFLPDGRVFACLLFIDVPSGHSFTFEDGRLEPNLAREGARSVVGANKSIGCPAMPLVNAALVEAAERAGSVCACVYDKTEIGKKDDYR